MATVAGEGRIIVGVTVITSVVIVRVSVMDVMRFRIGFWSLVVVLLVRVIIGIAGRQPE